MDTSPVTCRTLDDFYHIDASTFEKQYKDVLSGYRNWEELSHAEEWLVFPENIGPNLAIDETSLSNGDLYTIVTNRDRHGREMCLVAIVAGTKSETVIAALRHIPEHLLDSVEEVTLDLSDSMRKIVRSCFRKASRVIDRFHIQKLALLLVGGATLPTLFDAILCQYQMILDYFRLSDGGRVLVSGVRAPGEIAGHPELQAAYALGKNL